MKPIFRDGSWDAEIWRSVSELNEYHLPDAFEDKDLIIDVGAHVGAFSHACLSRGAGRVFAFEADRANFGLAVHNLSDYGDRARVYNLAVWRSDVSATTVRFSGYGNTPSGVSNTGGGNVLWNGSGAGQTVNTTDLDSLLRSAGRVRLLKLDCEASELPILLTSQELGRVTEIVGEYHEIGGEYNAATIPPAAKIDGRDRYLVGDLRDYLEAAGFTFTEQRSMTAHGMAGGGQPCNLGKFRAAR